MSAGDDARNPDPDQANWQLSQGLKICRSVITNYRAMLSNDGKLPSHFPEGAEVGASTIDETSLGPRE